MERMSVNPTAPAARSGSDRDSSTRRPKAFFLGAALFLASLLVLSACATRAEPRADVTSGSSPAARDPGSIRDRVPLVERAGRILEKTLKYTVGYPDRFPSLEDARTWFSTFVHWYNTEHQHSKLGYVTPQQRRTGTAEQIYAQRNHTILMAKQKHPLRWRTHKVRCYGAVPVTIVCRPLIQKELF